MKGKFILAENYNIITHTSEAKTHHYRMIKIVFAKAVAKPKDVCTSCGFEASR